MLRHKSSKTSFRRACAATAIVNGAALPAWIFWLVPMRFAA